MFGVLPVVATAICEHVFQELAFQFFERGWAYLPNFGWIGYKRGEPCFVPCPALKETCEKIQRSLRTKEFRLAGWEMKLNGVNSMEEWDGSPIRWRMDPGPTGSGSSTSGGDAQRDGGRAGPDEQAPF